MNLGELLEYCEQWPDDDDPALTREIACERNLIEIEERITPYQRELMQRQQENMSRYQTDPEYRLGVHAEIEKKKQKRDGHPTSEVEKDEVLDLMREILL